MHQLSIAATGGNTNTFLKDVKFYLLLCWKLLSSLIFYSLCCICYELSIFLHSDHFLMVDNTVEWKISRTRHTTFQCITLFQKFFWPSWCHFYYKVFICSILPIGFGHYCEQGIDFFEHLPFQILKPLTYYTHVKRSNVILKKRLIPSEEERAGKLVENGRFIHGILLLASNRHTRHL